MHSSVPSVSPWLFFYHDRRMNRRLQHLPREQATLLSVRGQAGAVELEHVVGGEFLRFLDRFTLHFFEQHRGRGLANDAALAIEEGVADFAVVAEFKFDPDDVAAQWIIVFVGVRGRRQMATMERVLVMVEDVFLIQFFFIKGHDWRLTDIRLIC
jgi:hypothetical protein